MGRFVRKWVCRWLVFSSAGASNWVVGRKVGVCIDRYVGGFVV